MDEIHLEGYERVGEGQHIPCVRNGEVALRDVAAAAAAILNGHVRGLLGLEESLRDEVTRTPPPCVADLLASQIAERPWPGMRS